jgi:hypothetical protein
MDFLMWEEPGSASLSSASPSSITEHTSSQLVGSSAIALDWLSSGSNNVKGGRRNGSDAPAGGETTRHGLTAINGDRKVVFCLTGPYLTRRATIGRLEHPPWQRAVRWTD